jgi:hypothetical protein
MRYIKFISVEFFEPKDPLYAKPHIQAPELRLNHLHRNRHLALAWDCSGYMVHVQWVLQPSKVKRILVKTIDNTTIAENQSFNGHLALQRVCRSYLSDLVVSIPKAALKLTPCCGGAL